MPKKSRKSPGSQSPDADSPSEIWLNCETLIPNDRAALEVAYRMCEGKTATQIVKETHPDLYGALKTAGVPQKVLQKRRAVEMIRVQRKVAIAVEKGFLVLRQPVSPALAAQLSKRFPGVTVTVADDRNVSDSSLVVCNTASIVVANKLRELAATLNDSETIYVGTCSGRTLRQTFRYLAASVDPFDEPVHRCCFVGTNSGYLGTEFTNRANFLACRLAEIYSARYMTVPIDIGHVTE